MSLSQEGVRSTTPEPLAGLIRDHRRIEAAVAETRLRIEEGLAAPSPGAAADAAEQHLWMLQLLLEDGVERHIAKEEGVLFPVLRRRLNQLTEFVEDMVAEHEQIKEQRDRLGAALATLDGDHAAVRETAAAIRTGLGGASAGGITGSLAGLRDAVERLDWILQGHFTGEEDGLFLPAEEFLDAATLAEMTVQMDAFDLEPPV